MSGVSESQRSPSPGPLSGGPKPLEHRSRRSMSVGRKLAYGVAAPLMVAALRLLWSTYRWTVVGDDSLRRYADEGHPMILTLWHEGIFVCARYLSGLGRLGVHVTYLVSPSVDGELAVRLLARIDGHVVRGSATRSGVKAMHGLYRAMVRRNASPVVLPDGPQGPRHSCKPGSLLLARLSGSPVVPVSCAASASWRLPTWDRQMVPKPFSRVAILVGEPYTIPSGDGEDEMERQRLALEDRLRELGDSARGMITL